MHPCSDGVQYGRPIYCFDSRWGQQFLYPAYSAPSFNALGKERTLLCSGKGNEEGIQLFTTVRFKAPPSLIVESVKYHRMEFKAFAFMDGH